VNAALLQQNLHELADALRIALCCCGASVSLGLYLFVKRLVK
jgi:hypothetical protein